MKSINWPIFCEKYFNYLKIIFALFKCSQHTFLIDLVDGHKYPMANTFGCDQTEKVFSTNHNSCCIGSPNIPP